MNSLHVPRPCELLDAKQDRPHIESDARAVVAEDATPPIVVRTQPAEVIVDEIFASSPKHVHLEMMDDDEAVLSIDDRFFTVRATANGFLRVHDRGEQ